MQPEARTKEPLPQEVKKEQTPVQQWDALAIQLIVGELAPKGFKEIKRGPFKGTVVANLDHLTKVRVDKTAKIAAQLVREYRKRAIKALNSNGTALLNEYNEAKADLEKCGRWQFRKKAELRKKRDIAHAQFQIMTQAIQQLNLISIQ